MAYQAVQL